MIHILPDTALGQIQLFRDLAVVQPLCHQPDNLIFPLSQRRQGFRTVKSGLSPLCGFSQFDDLCNRSGLQPLCQQWLEIAIILRKRNDKAVRFRVGQCLIELRLCLRMLTQHFIRRCRLDTDMHRDQCVVHAFAHSKQSFAPANDTGVVALRQTDLIFDHLDHRLARCKCMHG